MRIVSGTHKGRHISVRKNFPSRPTTDFAKESLFNVLNNHFDFDTLQVLDLFAGTGNISYEFASRGANVIGVEINYKSYRFIQDTARNMAFENLKVMKADVFKYLTRANSQWDLIFADPPYQLEDTETLPALIFENNLLKPEGWFILEHSDQKQFTGHPKLIDKRSYGSVNFSIFSR